MSKRNTFYCFFLCGLVAVLVVQPSLAQSVGVSGNKKGSSLRDTFYPFTPSPLKSQVSERVKIGVSQWFTAGEGEWEISFDWFDPDLLFGSGRSVLEWEDIDSNVTVIDGEVTIFSWLKLTGRYGFGDIDDGKNTDADFVSAPWIFVRDSKFSESGADNDGENTMYDLDVRVVLSALQMLEGYKGEIEMFLGYQYYTDELENKNGVQTWIEDGPANEPFPDHFASRYDFEWWGIRWGVSIDYPLIENLLVGAELGLLPYVNFEGEGFWNLRQDLRQDGPSFVHEADTGSGVDAEISLTYLPVENLGVEIGYRYMSWEAEDGKDTTHFADGSSGDASLDTVKSTRHGAFISVFGSF